MTRTSIFSRTATTRTTILVLAVAVFAAACSADGGGDELATPTTEPSTVEDTTTTSDTPTTTVFEDPVVGPGGPQEASDVDEAEVVQEGTPEATSPTTTHDGEDGHVHDGPVATYPTVAPGIGEQPTTSFAAPLTIPTDISSASELPPEVPIPPAEGFEVITADDTYTLDHDHTTTTVTGAPVATPTTAAPSVALPPIVGEPINASVVDTTDTFYNTAGALVLRTVPLPVEIGTLLSADDGFDVRDVVVVGFNDYGAFQEIEACEANGNRWAAYAWRSDDGLWRIDVARPASMEVDGIAYTPWRYVGATC